MKALKKIVSLGLIAVMLMSMLPLSVFADNKGTGTISVKDNEETQKNATKITVSTAEELITLAKDCQRDVFSENLIVTLEDDIDLSGVDFSPIPSFSGTFNGNNHTISGLSCAKNGSHQGLFRYLRKSGTVTALTVEGDVAPEGSRSAVGGIVGTNYGLIYQCVFSGEVSGQLSVGGIAGENYGTIRECTSYGTVQAKHFVGGIVGFNEENGAVGYCTNYMRINPTVVESTLDLDSIDLKDVLGVALINSDDSDIVSDAGGITGCNEGVIKGCENKATVGYQHYGYNIGGIAGRQSGYITSCTNSGDVLGRNDVGGIVGQMEPYTILDQKETMSDELVAVQKATDIALANLNTNSETLGGSVSDATEAGLKLSDKYYDTSGTFKKVMDEDYKITADDLPTQSLKTTVIDWSADTAETIAQKIKSKFQGYTDMLDEGTIQRVLNGDSLTAADESALVAITMESGENLLDLAEKYSEKLENIRYEEALQEQLDAAQYNEAINSGKKTGDNITELLSTLSVDLSEVSEHYNKILTMIANALSGEYELTVMTDISDEDSNFKEGKVESCSNKGNISGDKNIGGIAGSMAVEADFDLEGLISEEITDKIQLASTAYFCINIASYCLNDGEVNGKKEDVGGIVGLCELGNVTSCQNYGDITGTGENYGGIVGRSKTSVRRSFSMCKLEGEEYVGGIVGQGKTVEYCTAITEADANLACTGAVAGWLDLDDEEASVMFNYYVGDTLGGIDGISYDGICDEVDYEQLVTMKALPEQFRNLHITYVANGETVGEINFVYGDDVDTSLIPPVPEVEGSSGSWPDFDYTHVTRSVTLEAVYGVRTSVLSSAETRGDTPLSLVLVEGPLSQNTEMTLEKYNGGYTLPEGATEAYTVKLTDFDYGKTYNIRWNMGDCEAADIYVLLDGMWVKTDTRQNGSYLVFSGSLDEVTFCAVPVNRTLRIIEMAAVAAAVFIIILAVIVSSVRRRRKKKTGPKEKKSSGPVLDMVAS